MRFEIHFTNGLPIFLESQICKLSHQNEENYKVEELKKHIFDERNGLHYTLVGDYYLPDLQLQEEKLSIGIWGGMRKDYLEQYHPAKYNDLILSGNLWTYLADLNEQAQKQIAYLVTQLKVTEGVTEELKAHDPMTWVGTMNNIRNRAREIILQDLIYGEDVV